MNQIQTTNTTVQQHESIILTVQQNESIIYLLQTKDYHCELG